MPYKYPKAEKATSSEILRWIFSRSIEEKEAVCVYDVADALLQVFKASYGKAGGSDEDELKLRMNDASVRLRTLWKSGYLMRVDESYEDNHVSAKKCAARIDKRFGDRESKRGGRRPSIYVLTETGHAYAYTICDVYVYDHPDDGVIEVDRSEILDRDVKPKTWIAITSEGLRVAVFAKSKGDVQRVFETWANDVTKKESPGEIEKILPFVIDVERKE